MTPAELDTYRQRLESLARRLQGEVTGLAGEALRPTGPTPDDSSIKAPGDSGDMSAGQNTEDVSLSLLGNENQLLAETMAALERIRNGTYGRCVECGREIPTDRLDAVPYTPFCLDDARKAQREGVGPEAAGNL
jgi:RNA polymerase-binding transcription factor DksA